MNEKMILNNGTELNGYLLDTELYLFVYVHDKTLTEVFNLLNVPENVSTIRWERGEEKGEVKGDGKLVSISVERNNVICARFKK